MLWFCSAIEGGEIIGSILCNLMASYLQVLRIWLLHDRGLLPRERGHLPPHWFASGIVYRVVFITSVLNWALFICIIIIHIFPSHVPVITKGPFKCYVMLFSWKLDPHPPPRNANNVEPYTFVTLFSRKFDTPHPHLRYVTLEWPQRCSATLLFMMGGKHVTKYN